MRLRVGLGDQVKKGDLIAEIDSSVQQNALRTASSALANVRAQREAKLATERQTGLALQRLVALVDVDAGSRADLEAAEANLATARAEGAALDAQVAQAKIAEDAAKVNLGFARVVAPMNGTVVAIVTEQGQTINAAQSAPTIIKIARLDTVTVKAQISEADVARVRPGLPVHFSILGEPTSRYETTLRFIEPGPTTLASDTSSVSSSGSSSAIYYNGLFDVPNPQGRLRISMTAQATIVVAEARSVLLIPSAALGEKHSSDWYSVRVLKDASFVERRVRVGLDNRVQAEVLEGLTIGERVVTSEGGAHSNSPPGSLPGNRPQEF